MPQPPRYRAMIPIGCTCTQMHSLLCPNQNKRTNRDFTLQKLNQYLKEHLGQNSNFWQSSRCLSLKGKVQGLYRWKEISSHVPKKKPQRSMPNSGASHQCDGGTQPSGLAVLSLEPTLSCPALLITALRALPAVRPCSPNTSVQSCFGTGSLEFLHWGTQPVALPALSALGLINPQPPLLSLSYSSVGEINKVLSAIQ